MVDNNKEQKVINLKEVIKKVWSSRKLFYKVIPITMVLAAVYIFPVPRYYTCSVMLAPETETPSLGGGALGSLASSFGFDLNSMVSQDAISPTLYPDLMESNDFIVSLFDLKVKSLEGDINTTYYDYMLNHQAESPWGVPFKWIRELFKKEEKGGSGKIDPFHLTRKQKDLVDEIKSKIICDIDKKTDVITITVTDQDPLICATMTDSVRTRLQAFITDYRTNKARIDVEYYKQLTAQAKQDYEKARRLYGSYSDANNDIVLESFRAKQTDLENDMQLKYNTYSVLVTQLQSAIAKVQERTPAFTVLQGASVPVKPEGPRRMIFIAGMTFLICLITALWIARKELHMEF
ncbi:MAG: chain-length determining protein [Prevotella sp.]|nr:chain-length determining protein [Prevotella sp.]